VPGAMTILNPIRCPRQCLVWAALSRAVPPCCCCPWLQKLQTYVSGVSSQRGTLPWTAPEILRTPDAVTEKVDVYRCEGRGAPQAHGRAAGARAASLSAVAAKRTQVLAASQPASLRCMVPCFPTPTATPLPPALAW
jgi:serine/threonine protein kinase